MSTLTITIDLDNDAFKPDYTVEVKRILAITSLTDGKSLYDYNGNRVGKVTITGDDTDEPYYDWDKIPEGYDWAACDESGSAYSYGLKPKPHYVSGEWASDDDEFLPIINAAPAGVWHKSLRRRPQE